jgi:hypothetical protein
MVSVGSRDGEEAGIPLFLSAAVEDTFSSSLDTSRTWAFPIAFDLDRNALVGDASVKSKEAKKQTRHLEVDILFDDGNAHS